jgi:manganese transport protein
MLINEVLPFFEAEALGPKLLIGAAGTFFGAVLIYISVFPFFRKKVVDTSIEMHQTLEILPALTIPTYNNIAIALDFSANDHKIISYAIGQGKADANYLLIHIVESASAKLHGEDSDDFETKKDKAQLESYAIQLKEKGFTASAELGFRNRVKEIVRIVNEKNADMLVIGAHGHKGVKDILYGQTVNAVRHELKIPVLIVNL